MTDTPKPLPTHIKIPITLSSGILNYFLQRPLGEVNDLFHALKEATEVSLKESAPPES